MASLLSVEISTQNFIAAFGILIGIVSAVATAAFSLRGKKVDAGEWIMNTLQEDAQSTRGELRELKLEIEEMAEKARMEVESIRKAAETEISILKAAIANLQQREQRAFSYIRLMEMEISLLKDMLIESGQATPDMEFSLEDIKEIFPEVESVDSDLN